MNASPFEEVSNPGSSPPLRGHQIVDPVDLRPVRHAVEPVEGDGDLDLVATMKGYAVWKLLDQGS